MKQRKTLQHEVIKNLIAMNVPVHKWDKKPAIFKKMVNLKWHKDCVPKLEYLVTVCQLEATVSFPISSELLIAVIDSVQSITFSVRYLSYLN